MTQPPSGQGPPRPPPYEQRAPRTAPPPGRGTGRIIGSVLGLIAGAVSPYAGFSALDRADFETPLIPVLAFSVPMLLLGLWLAIWRSTRSVGLPFLVSLVVGFVLQAVLLFALLAGLGS